MPLKFIISQYIIEWNLTDEANIVDMGNDFSLGKFPNSLGYDEVLEGYHWFVGGQIYSH